MSRGAVYLAVACMAVTFWVGTAVGVLVAREAEKAGELSALTGIANMGTREPTSAGV